MLSKSLIKIFRLNPIVVQKIKFIDMQSRREDFVIITLGNQRGNSISSPSCVQQLRRKKNNSQPIEALGGSRIKVV